MTQSTSKDSADTYNYIGWTQLTEAAREGHYHLVENVSKADRTNAIVAHLSSMTKGLPCEPYIIACTVHSRENAIKAAKHIRKKATEADFALMWWSCARYSESTNSASNKPHRMVVAFRAFGLQDLVGLGQESMAAFTMKVEINLPEVQIKIGTPEVQWVQSFAERDLVEVLKHMNGKEYDPVDLLEATEGMLKAIINPRGGGAFSMALSHDEHTEE